MAIIKIVTILKVFLEINYLKNLHIFLVAPSSGADVALVVDYATTPDVIKQLKAFTSSIIDGLDISPSGFHVGLITYGANATIVIPFNELDGPLLNRDAIKSLVDIATPMPGSPRIDRALQLADQKLFTAEGGARPGVPKVRISISWSGFAVNYFCSIQTVSQIEITFRQQVAYIVGA